jgi:hypothetical protein
MLRRNLIACSLATALAASAGCYSDAEVAPAYAYSYGEPGLETVSPGVEVVTDLDYPVFYSDGFYWMWDGGFWYRSHSWRGGWIGVGPRYVPWGIRGIREPLAYSHWHGGRSWGVARGPVYRGGVYRGGVYRGGVYRGGVRGPSVQPHWVARGGGGFRGGGFRGGGHGHR